MNAINVIAPYKYLDMWVFDDERVGLLQEPFVCGADTMIDQVVATIPDPESGFIMLFSADPFPGHQITLSWRRADSNGNWYFSEQLDMEGWLCPALLKYFEQPPKEIYVQVKAKSNPLIKPV
ncbi:MAG: DUF6717 family protein [Pseudomonadota bacterium]